MSRNVHKNFYHYFTASKKRGSMCKAQNNKMKYVFYINDIVHSIFHIALISSYQYEHFMLYTNLILPYSTSQLAFTGRWLYLF